MGDEKTQVTVEIRGVVMPVWVAVLLACCLIISCLSFLLAYMELRKFSVEVRVLQLHVQDVESVLIREGVASRKDFAEWTVKDKR